jgi:hypothetical protein
MKSPQMMRVMTRAEGGHSVAEAVILPEGLRTKPGPYVSGWYGWRTETNGGVANPPLTTDREGYARVPYPKYVFERIETGTLCLAVTHPDFVADRPERVVATAPPAVAPDPEQGARRPDRAGGVEEGSGAHLARG